MTVVALAESRLAPDLALRSKICNLQEAITGLIAGGAEQPECPLKHVFAPGAYAREIFIPAGSIVVGKIHKHAHLNMLMNGRVTVITEKGREELTGPLTMVSQAGTKRALYAHEDTVWVTVHLTEETDLAKIEDEIIAKDFKELEQFYALENKS